ncbi:MAG: hypothetical protein JWQ32_1160 [Marmoricola sp.]|nr:hypothetical protein [Marmoricola sp.]
MTTLAMSNLELVGLWVGLIGGVVSIVLALVAMAFTFAVDRRSTSINEQVIKSLQKIESTVEGVAADTTNLIKVAWERMLPGVDGTSPGSLAQDAADDQSVQAIAAGVAAELRAELAPSGTPNDAEAIRRLDSAVRRMERTMRAQLSSSAPEPVRPSSRVDRLQHDLASLSPEALELVRQMASVGKHLTREQYLNLRTGPLDQALRQLRGRGIIGPLKGLTEQDEEIPVYFFSPTVYRYVRPLLSIQDPPSPAVREGVGGLLAAVGYRSNFDSEQPED